jgi:hypothetical protein
MTKWLALVCLLGGSAACSPVDCDYDLEGNPVNCRSEPGSNSGEPLPVEPSVTLVPTSPAGAASTVVAVGGTTVVHVMATGGAANATLGAPFTLAHDGSDLDVVAAAAGSANLTVAVGSAASATLPITAANVATFDYDAVDYTPQLGARAAAILSPLSIAIRLRDADGGLLVDTTLDATADATTQWDVFYLDAPAGTATVNLGAASFGNATVPVQVVDHLDAIQFLTTSAGVPTGYQHVCAYGVTGNVEVAARFDMFANGPNVSQQGGESNCMIVEVDTGGATVLARDGNGLEATMKI